MVWVYDDGGRADSGYKGTTGDCVVRAIAIAVELPYKQVRKDLAYFAKIQHDAFWEAVRLKWSKVLPSPSTFQHDVDQGTHRDVYESYLLLNGWKWTATMRPGPEPRVHLKYGELPTNGRLIVRVSRHLVAVVDGVIHDTGDPSRGGTRCVYGYYVKE